MMQETGRQQRVEARLLRLLNELLQFEVKDPRLTDVRITAVDLSRDLGIAKVYYSTLQPDADAEPVDSAFERARGFLRSRIGRALRLRRVPELRFRQDMSSKRGIELTALIDEAASGGGRSDDR
jgi:ribosome-binding factor A